MLPKAYYNVKTMLWACPTILQKRKEKFKPDEKTGFLSFSHDGHLNSLSNCQRVKHKTITKKEEKIKQFLRQKLLTMKSPVTKFMNCYILRGHKIQKEDLYVRDGKVLNPEPFFYDEKKSPDVVIDCNGCLIAPG
jgi:hypothetical protein